ncbi:DNA/RNA non-specific endonuclease [Facilibium subflavum]|uniref:DNA/RNA non-specific endonuclease n=1 Tax=Facilibium subflavum TaxID=2219058 RepID=UPI0013C35AFD|nr:DNA/RNA non-specific endonuclease [Facilibium subflavum]
MKATIQRSLLKTFLFIASFFVAFNAFATTTQPIQCHDFLTYGAPEPASNNHSAVNKVNQYLCRDGYVVGYSYLTKQPVFVAYHLSSKSVDVTIKRHDQFTPDPAIPAQFQAQLSDYRNSGYDRGHLAPYAAMDFNKESAAQSFLLSNMSPQYPGLNRQGWAQLEKYVRFWANMYQSLFVYTGAIYKKGKIHKTIGKNKIAVPDAFFKVIYAPKQDKTIAFIMPNAKVSRKKVAQYRVSITEVAQRTGLNFLTNLPKAQQQKLVLNTSPMWRTAYTRKV